MFKYPEILQTVKFIIMETKLSPFIKIVKSRNQLTIKHGQKAEVSSE